ncbi:MAG: IS21 family transposase, partial [Acinetobacter sp.]
MLKMSQINHIRDLSKCGYKVSEIHKETGVDHKTIEKYLAKEDFSEEPPIQKTRKSILDPYKPLIAQWLEEDKNHWRKQRHTAKRIYDRLSSEHGYTGSYDTIRKYVHKIRKDTQLKASQELIWLPGYAQVDFGEADFYEENKCRRRKYLVVSFPFSNDGYAQLFGGETAECVCQGLQDIFEYIGGVPEELVFDNATGVGRRVHDLVTETALFLRFRAHYGFRIRFCNPAAGYEKGNVENKVGTIRRNLFVPVPHYHDMTGYNKQLLDEHLKKAAETHYKKGDVISQLFEEDKSHFSTLPSKRFNVCRYHDFKCDGYGKICMEGKHFYSTRPENRGGKVWAGIRAHFIDILNPDGSLLIRHRREYGDSRTDSSDYSTSLEVLSRHAGAWKNSGVRNDTPDLLREYLDSLPKADLKA